ncbi:hypothetical protein KP509_26G000700 [Ceratopteris richardii]|uniref:EF-hand domain-containing protein n=1 Tax=Ceratopteris richardii TaxID=49495 RepID=A0A8T2RK76_CERRI|nr:hypothetical protein KP509_26G000700 [Ceratopteris richardii]
MASLSFMPFCTQLDSHNVLLPFFVASSGGIRNQQELRCRFAPVFSLFQYADFRSWSSSRGFCGYRRGRQPRFFHAVCFKDEVASLNLEKFDIEDYPPVAADSETSISCTTFNILAPIYKRVNKQGIRESDFRESWLSRNNKIVELLLLSNSSVICLQEFWLGNRELEHLYVENLKEANYSTYKLARTNSRGDGLLTAVKNTKLKVLDYKELFFNDCGDRVAQFFCLQANLPGPVGEAFGMELLLVNTHLIFPHNFNYCLIRLRQVYKILTFIEQYKREHSLASAPVILCGDWNGSKRGRVYKFICSQGYLSSYDMVHDCTGADSHRWISHKNHRGDICEVDFIWFSNSEAHEKPLLVSWYEAVFATIKMQGNTDVITVEEFQHGLKQLELTESAEACSAGLSRTEIDELIEVIDTDRNGVIDYDEFEAFLGEDTALVSLREPIAGIHSDGSIGTTKESSQSGQLSGVHGDHMQIRSREFHRGRRFTVKDASLFPPEVEGGVWPEEYSLSDHAAVTVTFDLQGL